MPPLPSDDMAKSLTASINTLIAAAFVEVANVLEADVGDAGDFTTANAMRLVAEHLSRYGL